MAEEKPAVRGNPVDKEMPAGMTKVFGKVGAKTWLDFLVMIAGILCIINVIVQLTTFTLNGWLVVYYIILLWVYVDVALFIKLGPFFASKFKNVSGAFSFLRDENDAKNFMVIIGGWSAVLDALSHAIVGSVLNPLNPYAFVIWVYLPALVIFGIFLLKGFLAKK